MDIFSLKNRRAVLTGAAGFLGGYFKQVLEEFGAKVITVDKADADYVVDLYDRELAKAVFEAIIIEYGHVDVLINNAFDFSLKTGFNHPSGRLETATYEQLCASFESGIYWAIQATQFFGALMKVQGCGSIINICSMYAVIVPSPDLYEGTEKFNPPGYSMAKAGLLQFTKYSASFLAPEVRVNAISPGAFPNIEMGGCNSIIENDPLLQRLCKKILLKRMGHPKDLFGALIFLASDASGYITGQNIIVDGGIVVT